MAGPGVAGLGVAEFGVAELGEGACAALGKMLVAHANAAAHNSPHPSKTR